MPVRVLLADDHAVVRDGLRMILESQPDITVIGDAADGRAAVDLAMRLSPDVVVMDIAMPGLNGIDAAQQIRECCRSTQVVILSMHATSEHVYRALRAGALGYLLKESAGKEVPRAVRDAHAGKRFMSDRIADLMADLFVGDRDPSARLSPLDQLSGREREVLQLVVEGKSSAEIGRIIHLSPKTVETYRSRLMKKLGVRDLSGLVRFAIEHGLTSLQ